MICTVFYGLTYVPVQYNQYNRGCESSCLGEDDVSKNPNDNPATLQESKSNVSSAPISVLSSSSGKEADTNLVVGKLHASSCPTLEPKAKPNVTHIFEHILMVTEKKQTSGAELKSGDRISKDVSYF